MLGEYAVLSPLQQSLGYLPEIRDMWEPIEPSFTSIAGLSTVSLPDEDATIVVLRGHDVTTDVGLQIDLYLLTDR